MQAYITGPEVDRRDAGQCDDCEELAPGAAQELRDCMIDTPTARALAGIFKALSDPTRLRIISALAEREFCVGDLAEALGMEQSAVSHQLGDMRDMGLVRSRKQGRHVYYRLDDEHVRDLFRLTLAHVRHANG
jgi:DNA-binding transcriptional ArsR family regulator